MWEFAARLKEERRRGWTRASDIERVESVADHSFGLAILSLCEAMDRGYDVGRAMALALIHDLEEAITGDLTPDDKRGLTRTGLSRRRNGARMGILSRMPRGRRRVFSELWSDLDSGRTREAKLVKDLDKLEMALQARRYESFGASHASLARFYRSAVDGIVDSSIRKRARGLALGRT